MRFIFATAGVVNFAWFVATSGYCLNLWGDPKIDAGIILPALVMAGIAQIEIAVRGRL